MFILNAQALQPQWQTDKKQTMAANISQGDASGTLDPRLVSVVKPLAMAQPLRLTHVPSCDIDTSARTATTLEQGYTIMTLSLGKFENT